MLLEVPYLHIRVERPCVQDIRRRGEELKIVSMLTTHNDGRVFVKTHSWYLAIMGGYAADRLPR